MSPDSSLDIMSGFVYIASLKFDFKIHCAPQALNLQKKITVGTKNFLLNILIEFETLKFLKESLKKLFKTLKFNLNLLTIKCDFLINLYWIISECTVQ